MQNIQKNIKICKLFFLAIFILSLSGAAGAVDYAEGVKNPFDLPEVINVTGNPASPQHIRYVLMHFIMRSGLNSPNLEKIDLQKLLPGQEEYVTLQISNNTKGADSNGIFTKKILVKNELVPYIPSKFLAFSNHPERLTKPGLLFQAGIIRNKPIRLRYYHYAEEKIPKNRYVGFYLLNATNKPARIQIIESLGGPSKNFMEAGNLNNYYFFRRRAQDQGWIEEVPPQTALPVRIVPLQPGEVISSTCDLHLVSGGPLQLITNASDSPEDRITYPLQSDDKDRHARGVYPLTNIFTEAYYKLTQDQYYFTLGDTKFPDLFKGKDIKGSYGIMYSYNIAIENPYKEKRAVTFSFQPRGGPATATFSFNNRPVRVKCTKAYEMVRLTRIEIPPKSTKIVSVKTMPEDASNYPIRLYIITEKK